MNEVVLTTPKAPPKKLTLAVDETQQLPDTENNDPKKLKFLTWKGQLVTVGEKYV